MFSWCSAAHCLFRAQCYVAIVLRTGVGVGHTVERLYSPASAQQQEQKGNDFQQPACCRDIGTA